MSSAGAGAVASCVSRQCGACGAAEPSAVDGYGFFLDATGAAPRASPSPTRTTALVDGDAAHERWWMASLHLYESMHCSADAQAPLLHLRKGLEQQWGRQLTAHGGLPSGAVRRRAWAVFSGAALRPAAQREHDARWYAARCSERAAAVQPALLTAMERDLPRTFPAHCLFRMPTEEPAGGGPGDRAGRVVPLGVGQQQLLRVLAVYSLVDGEVGYCQGMAFVAGLMLLQAPEAEAFELFRHVLCGERLQARRLYLPGFPLLVQLVGAFGRAVRLLLPRLHAHLAAEQVRPSAFASQWFLTLYATQLPAPLWCRLWDFFLLAGWRVWLQVGVGLLAREERALLAAPDMEAVLLHLQRCARHRWQITDEFAALATWLVQIPVPEPGL